MKSKYLIFFIFFVVILTFIQANFVYSSIKTSVVEKQTINKLLEIHNKERVSRGYKPLVLDKNLCAYAQKHASYMAEKNILVHSSMSNLQKANEDANVVGENIAWGQETEEDVVSSWMWSPGHRWNILGSSYKRVGFGMKLDKNSRKYWCVVFSD